MHPVNEHKAKELLEDFERRAKDLGELNSAINRELKEHNEQSRKDGKSTQFGRRTYVRTTFACIEAYVSHLKQSALMFSLDQPQLFSPEEVLMLDERDPFVASNGAVKTRTAKIRLKENVKLAFGSIARATGGSYNVDYSAGDGPKFLEAIKIRNRVTHPKTAADWELSEEEVQLVKDAWSWFGIHLVNVMRDADGRIGETKI